MREELYRIPAGQSNREYRVRLRYSISLELGFIQLSRATQMILKLFRRFAKNR